MKRLRFWQRIYLAVLAVFLIALNGGLALAGWRCYEILLNGSQAVSAEWVNDGVWYNSTAAIDVTLDNGEHVLCFLRGIDSYELMGYERHHSSYLDTMYGNQIAELQVLMKRRPQYDPL